MAKINKDEKSVDQTGYNITNTGNFSENYQSLYRETLDTNRKYQENLAEYCDTITSTSDDAELGALVREIFNANFDFYVDNNVVVEGGFSK
tara:strand:- start:117 stop:389 length:273 start_codon:yes stop_codon:yes gene_type:complete